ncbi:PD40 domain-containing protein, partial [bacterium]|nr:PD40 domain-containing protein [bacterium]
NLATHDTEMVEFTSGLIGRHWGYPNNGWKLLTSNGTYFYGLSYNKYDYFSFTEYDPEDNFKLLREVKTFIPGSYITGILADNNFLYAITWTGTITKIDLSDGSLNDQWTINNGTTRCISGQYDVTNNEAWLGSYDYSYVYNWKVDNLTNEAGNFGNYDNAHDVKKWTSYNIGTNLTNLYSFLQPNQLSVAYQHAYINSAFTQEALLKIGSDDAVKAWVNHSLVLSHDVGRGASPDQEVITIEVYPGWNTLLLKITNYTGGWGSYCRLTDMNGTNPLSNVTIATTKDDLGIPEEKYSLNSEGFITDWMISSSFVYSGSRTLGHNTVFINEDSVEPSYSGELLSDPMDAKNLKIAIDPEIIVKKVPVVTGDTSRYYHFYFDILRIEDGISLSKEAPAYDTVKVYFDSELKENIYWSNSYSEGLYVLENKNIAANISVPPLKGINPYNWNAGTPCRMIARNGDSESYRRNYALINMSYFKFGSHTIQTTDFSGIQTDEASVVVKADSTTDFDFTFKYELESNYLKVTAYAFNKTASAQTGSFMYNSHHWPRYPWYTDDGTIWNYGDASKSCSKWAAFVPTNYNDILGYTVDAANNVTLRLYYNWVYIEEPDTTIMAGTTHEFSFCIVTDRKGDEGDDTLPIESVYNLVSGGEDVAPQISMGIADEKPDFFIKVIEDTHRDYQLYTHKEDVEDSKDLLTWDIADTDATLYMWDITTGENNDMLGIDPLLNKKGENMVRFHLFDSEGAFSTQDVNITIEGKNTPPSITGATLEPNPAYFGDNLMAIPIGWSDQDFDPESYFYEWRRNGKVIPGEKNTILRGDKFAIGDDIEVIITPFDGKEIGEAKESGPMTIMYHPYGFAISGIIDKGLFYSGVGRYFAVADLNGGELEFQFRSSSVGEKHIGDKPFRGPDGNADTWYKDGLGQFEQIGDYHGGERWLQYKVKLVAPPDQKNSPIYKGITIEFDDDIKYDIRWFKNDDDIFDRDNISFSKPESFVEQAHLTTFSKAASVIPYFETKQWEQWQARVTPNDYKEYGELTLVAGDNFLQFNGNGDCVITPHVSSMNSQSISIELWGRKDGYGALLEKGQTYLGEIETLAAKAFTGESRQWSLICSNDIPTFKVYDTANNEYSISGLKPISFDVWHHFAGTYDYTTGILAIYFDGQLINSVNIGQIEIMDTKLPFSVGCTLNSTDGTDSRFYWNGAIDEVRLLNRALTSIEVLEDFEASYNNGRYFPERSDTTLFYHYDHGIGTTATNSSGNSGGSGGLSDVVVNSRSIKISVYDHGTIDADQVDISINGVMIPGCENYTLVAEPGKTFNVILTEEINTLVVHADNEGFVSPNTAAIVLTNVVDGLAKQFWQLNSGDNASFSIKNTGTAREAGTIKGPVWGKRSTRIVDWTRPDVDSFTLETSFDPAQTGDNEELLFTGLHYPELQFGLKDLESGVQNFKIFIDGIDVTTTSFTTEDSSYNSPHVLNLHFTPLWYLKGGFHTAEVHVFDNETRIDAIPTNYIRTLADGTILTPEIDNTGWEIFSMNADGGEKFKLSSSVYSETYPIWSPNSGSKIILNSDRDGNLELYSVNPDGTGQTRLTFNSAIDEKASVNTDESKIVFRSERDGNGEIYAMNIDGSSQVNLTNSLSNESSPIWSPDGTKIVYTSNGNDNWDIYVMNSNGSSQINMTKSFSNESEPNWSPDGSKIAFASQYNNIMDIFVMDSNGTNKINLTNSPSNDSNPIWSPDGTKITFTSDKDGDYEIYTMNSLDGNGMIKITNNGSDDLYPRYSPNGGKIAFMSNRYSHWDVFTMNTDGNLQTRLTNNIHSKYSHNNCYPRWSPDSQSITYSSDSGNHLMTVEFWNFLIDDTPPVVLLSSPYSAVFSNAVNSIDIKMFDPILTDEASGMALESAGIHEERSALSGSMFYGGPDGEIGNEDDMTVEGTWDWSTEDHVIFTPTNTLTDEIYLVKVQPIDWAGNIGDPVHLYVVIDNKPPEYIVKYMHPDFTPLPVNPIDPFKGLSVAKEEIIYIHTIVKEVNHLILTQPATTVTQHMPPAFTPVSIETEAQNIVDAGSFNFRICASGTKVNDIFAKMEIYVDGVPSGIMTTDSAWQTIEVGSFSEQKNYTLEILMSNPYLTVETDYLGDKSLTQRKLTIHNIAYGNDTLGWEYISPKSSSVVVDLAQIINSNKLETLGTTNDKILMYSYEDTLAVKGVMRTTISLFGLYKYDVKKGNDGVATVQYADGYDFAGNSSVFTSEFIVDTTNPIAKFKVNPMYVTMVPTSGYTDETADMTLALEKHSLVEYELPASLQTGLVAEYKFESSDARDTSGNGLTGEVKGTLDFVDGVRNRYAVFDGMNGYISVPDYASLNVTNNLTISGWIRPAKHGLENLNGNIGIIDKSSGGFNDLGTGYSIRINGNKLEATYSDGTVVPTRIDSTTALDYKNWVFFTYVVSNGNTQNLYINSTLVKTDTTNGTLAHSGELLIGKNYDSDNTYIQEQIKYFQGDMDNIRIWNRSLDITEIETLYTNEKKNNVYLKAEVVNDDVLGWAKVEITQFTSEVTNNIYLEPYAHLLTWESGYLVAPIYDLNDGIATIKFTYADIAGNTVEHFYTNETHALSNETFIVDTVVPIVISTQPINELDDYKGSFTKEITNITIKMTDEALFDGTLSSGVDNNESILNQDDVECRLIGSNTDRIFGDGDDIIIDGSWDTSGTQGTIVFNLTSGVYTDEVLPDDYYKLVIYPSDLAEHVGNKIEYILYFTVDSIAPKIDISLFHNNLLTDPLAKLRYYDTPYYGERIDMPVTKDGNMFIHLMVEDDDVNMTLPAVAQPVWEDDMIELVSISVEQRWWDPGKAPLTDITSGISEGIDNTTYDVYTMNIDGSNDLNISNTVALDSYGRWNPQSGNKILFQSMRDGNLEIYVMDTDGNNQTLLSNNPAEDGAAAWSPDGTTIIFDSNRNGPWQLFTMNPDGSNQIQIPNSDDFREGIISPDGTQTVCNKNDEMYTMDLDGSNQLNISNFIPATGFDRSPSWSP